MIIYLQSINYNLWLSIENGPHKPIKIKTNIVIPKPRSEYIDGDKKFYMDAKAMNTLYCALSVSEFNIISYCKNARDM